jgi:hypothetical protein
LFVFHHHYSVSKEKIIQEIMKKDAFGNLKSKECKSISTQILTGGKSITPPDPPKNFYIDP